MILRPMLGVLKRAWLPALVLLALPSAPAWALDCGGVATPQRVGKPAPWRAWRATLPASAPAYAEPGVRPSGRVRPGDASALLVLDARDRDGRCWVRVRLPSRPNHAAAWVSEDGVQLSSTPWRLVVDTHARRLDVLRHGRLVRRLSVVVGAPATPTPHGVFAIAGVWKWHRRDFLGAWVLTLTAHSDVLRRFDGGDGRVALHGRGGASLNDPLGSARSHGCVRLANTAISWLVGEVGDDQLPGTPVVVG